MYNEKLDQQRINGYEEYKNLYRAEHEKVFSLDGTRDFPNVIPNMCNAIIDGLSGITTSNSPKFILENPKAQKAVDGILTASSFSTTELNQYVTEGLLYGDALLKVIMVDGNPIIRCISPKRWYPICDPQDVDTIVEHRLVCVKKSENGVSLALVERHVKIDGTFRVINEVRMLKEDKFGETVVDAGLIRSVAPEWLEIPVEWDTGIDEALIIPWNHDKLCGDLFGTSELAPIKSLIYALDLRATQEHRVLSKHADPKLILQEGTFQKDENGNIVITDLDTVILPHGSSKDQIGYITWDGQLGSVGDQIERLIEQQLQITQVTRLLLKAEGTNASTGEAFRIQLFPSILKATHIQRSLEKSLQTAIRVAQKMYSAHVSKIKVSPAQVKWGVDFPMNKQSEIQAAAQAVESGIKSRDEVREELGKNVDSKPQETYPE